MTALLFDLDGTLLDTLEDLADGVNHALAEFGYPLRTLEEIRQFVGNGVFRLMQLSVPEGADPEPPFRCFQSFYKEHCQIKTRPYDGIPEALSALAQNYPLAIVSNKPDAAVKNLCAQYFPGIYARGESADCPRKPAPDMVFKAMEALKADRCIYIGDSEVDVLTSQNAGVPCLSVTWGFRDEDTIRQAGGTHFCREPAQLVRAIEELVSNGD